MALNKCPATIFSLLSNNAEQKPEDLAILSPDQTALSYGELVSHAESVANILNEFCIGRNDRVAIVLENGPEMAVCFLSVAACATSAPLNPAYKFDDFDFYFSDLRANALIIGAEVDSPARAVARVHDIPTFDLHLDPCGTAGKFTLTPPPGVQSTPKMSGFADTDDVALVLHTSGTTSRPKIVPLTHKNITASARNISSTLKLKSVDRCINVMPLFHIHGLMGALLSTITARASIVCTSGFKADKFFGWIDDFTPSWYSAVPTIHQAVLVNAPKHTDIIKNNPLRFIRSSSSSLPPNVMMAIEKMFNCPMIEAYGMTEASHQMASNPLPPVIRKPGSVGPPAGPEMGIMDDQGELLKTGQVGEIVIRGPNVTNGYEGNPEANVTAFTKSWFRTGDQGYVDEDGYFFISGRLKEIINRGGEKIIPREIDEVLLAHPSVTQAVAFAMQHPTLGEDVVAAVVLDEDARVSEDGLREFAFEELAHFKVPSKVVIVDEIPKGATGKIQRIGLGEKLASRLSAEYMEPRDETERVLADIWAEAIGKERVGVLDNFFFLGGDSLTAVEVSLGIDEKFGFNLPTNYLFRKPTVSAQARLINALISKENSE